MTSAEDIRLMERALVQARLAAAAGEVPVGAVVVDADGAILAEAGNNCIDASDPAGHAEMIALRRAALRLGNYRLPGTTLYVTLEPCLMCAGLLVHARIERLVFAASDPKAGAIRSCYRIGDDGLLNHRFAVTGGVCAEAAAGLLRDFFRNRRVFSVVKKQDSG
ncbi:MAG: tRNA adenosine(34) deaminase TadA [Desulfobulbus sp.]|jgi:tRNA(adenine34) deaminase